MAFEVEAGFVTCGGHVVNACDGLTNGGLALSRIRGDEREALRIASGKGRARKLSASVACARLVELHAV